MHRVFQYQKCFIYIKFTNILQHLQTLLFILSMYFVYISDPLYPAHTATPERQKQH